MSDQIGGLSVGMVNLVVFLVIIGTAFLASMGWGFYRMFKGGSMSFPGAQEPGQDQVNYMRQVRYRTRLGMFVASQEAKKASRNSKMTDEESSYHYA
ncbi:hypothetical protein TMatcc_005225 [Talaromyces marneffei ATCC 18224]|uniref:Uncharacterized protein n=1 Tax=Talaromyces marneffei (strain ATCC 18224 / CBS 334.59 / QM 7333) TaxID=441960 RepID=B6QBQ6_TALMQ|nr:uncharacterized protein EYB26_006208 [Talaromyces marneffei]EEA26497.1 hypothetical protein PMAA_075650 [Talaromyces marneffei ATCC 18224]KAE8555186.1 hypothetical protein EYB25_003734 [Talaromyces marneffei]QGA18523.1 hypothetical protein EYB26_006208 [Talaromyces marneffei]